MWIVAQQITPRVQRWLRNSRSAQILYVFKEASTLTNERNEAISLVSPDIGPGPFSAVIEGDFLASLDTQQPVAVDVSRHTVTVGSLIVDFRESTVWQPRPDWRRLRGADIDEWPSAADLPTAIDNYLKLTMDGIIANDPSICLAGVEGLAGRGAGLTPTGDDVLMGILYGLWVWHPYLLRRSRQNWMEMIPETAVPRTTTLSANFIRAAAAGEASWSWHDLVNGRSFAAERILSIGHTSGADAWAGFMYTNSVLMSALSRSAA